MKWKVYFWAMVVYLIAGGIYLYLYSPGALGFGLMFDVVFLIGLFGYSYSKPILNKSFWLVVFIASILVYGNGILLSPYYLYSAFGSVEIEEVLISWLPFLPMLAIPYALYQYMRHSNEIWNRN